MRSASLRLPEQRGRPRSPTLLRFDGLGQISDVALALDASTQTRVWILRVRDLSAYLGTAGHARRRATVAAGTAARHTVAPVAEWNCWLSIPAARPSPEKNLPS
jgi:hypothetical protein